MVVCVVLGSEVTSPERLYGRQEGVVNSAVGRVGSAGCGRSGGGGGAKLSDLRSVESAGGHFFIRASCVIYSRDVESKRSGRFSAHAYDQHE